ncbi:hypothetical protein ASF49_14250 [Methylobacterium sp. Leaf104]|nr:hypothetical protein ASF49_14250 [Methylobacterium sp. Leaf104]
MRPRRFDGSLGTSVIKSGPIAIDPLRSTLQPFEHGSAGLPDAAVLFEESEGSIDHAHDVIHESRSLTLRTTDMFTGR